MALEQAWAGGWTTGTVRGSEAASGGVREPQGDGQLPHRGRGPGVSRFPRGLREELFPVTTSFPRGSQDTRAFCLAPGNALGVAGVTPSRERDAALVSALESPANCTVPAACRGTSRGHLRGSGFS